MDTELISDCEGSFNEPPALATDAEPFTQDLTTYYFTAISKTPLLTAEQEHTLSRQAKAGDVEARNKLITSNLRLVVSVAKAWMYTQEPLLDLVQAGNAGLIRAVDKFNPERGLRFSTYAYWWIRQSISNMLAEHHLVYLPRIVQQHAYACKKAAHTLGLDLTSEADLEKVAEATKLDLNKVKDCLRHGQQAMTSIDNTTKTEDDGLPISILDQLDSVESAEDTVMARDALRNLSAMLSQLPPKQRDVLERRYGIGGHEPQTLLEIGDLYGLTRERIRQIENLAVKSLKNKVAHGQVQEA